MLCVLFVHAVRGLGSISQDAHLKEMVAGGDEAHRQAHDEMKGRWKRPISGMGWYRATKREFAALPEG